MYIYKYSICIYIFIYSFRVVPYISIHVPVHEVLCSLLDYAFNHLQPSPWSRCRLTLTYRDVPGIIQRTQKIPNHQVTRRSSSEILWKFRDLEIQLGKKYMNMYMIINTYI